MNKRKNRQKTDEQSNLMMDNFIEKLDEQKKKIFHVSIFHVKINATWICLNNSLLIEITVGELIKKSGSFDYAVKLKDHTKFH